MIFQETIISTPFKKWLWTDKENKRLLLFSMASISISFIWLKILYPYPNFIPPDSFSYLEAAHNNEFINIWPIGYSKFLRLVSSLSNSHALLVVLQYLLLQCSLLYFLFTIRYLLFQHTWVFRILFAFSILNPLLPHVANFVSSDCLFTTLSMMWFTQLLWIVYQPNLKLLLVHAIILLCAFMVRHNALCYPFLSIAVIFMSSVSKQTKWLGISSILLLLLIFIGRTQYEYSKSTNTFQYSAFGGWQLAANALYGYAYAKTADPLNVPKRFRELHKLVNHHMDSIRYLAVRPDENVGIYYLWDFKSPLRIYMDQQWKNDSTTAFFTKWASLSPLYADYGRYLSIKYFKHFLKHYAWSNLQRYYAPPTYFMGMYNLGNETVDPIVVNWFGWNNNKLQTRLKDRNIYIAQFFPTLVAIINPLFLLAVSSFMLFGGFKRCNLISKHILWYMIATWITNMAFSVLSAPIELRYQLFPFIISFSFMVLLIPNIIQLIKSPQKTTSEYSLSNLQS